MKEQSGVCLFSGFACVLNEFSDYFFLFPRKPGAVFIILMMAGNLIFGVKSWAFKRLENK
jgi:hypothetical protein